MLAAVPSMFWTSRFEAFNFTVDGALISSHPPILNQRTTSMHEQWSSIVQLFVESKLPELSTLDIICIKGEKGATGEVNRAPSKTVQNPAHC